MPRQERDITKRKEETLGGDRYIHNLNSSDDYMAVSYIKTYQTVHLILHAATKKKKRSRTLLLRIPQLAVKIPRAAAKTQLAK